MTTIERSNSNMPIPISVVFFCQPLHDKIKNVVEEISAEMMKSDFSNVASKGNLKERISKMPPTNKLVLFDILEQFQYLVISRQAKAMVLELAYEHAKNLYQPITTGLIAHIQKLQSDNKPIFKAEIEDLLTKPLDVFLQELKYIPQTLEASAYLEMIKEEAVARSELSLELAQTIYDCNCAFDQILYDPCNDRTIVEIYRSSWFTLAYRQLAYTIFSLWRRYGPV